MTGLVNAIQRQQGRAQALQAYALRVAAWGKAEDFERLMDGLNGVVAAPREIADAGELMQALGWADRAGSMNSMEKG